MRRFGAWILVLALCAPLVVVAAEQARIGQREARVRATKQKFGEALVVLHEGDVVTVLASETPWVRVSARGVEGWLHESAITRGSGGSIARALVGTEVEATERTAGQKGFDSVTEASFRASQPQLDTAFAIVDRIDRAAPDEGAVAAFARAGELRGGAR